MKNLPAGQVVHVVQADVAPLQAMYRPEGQLEHDPELVPVEYCPAGQYAQTRFNDDDGFLVMYSPATQLAHVEHKFKFEDSVTSPAGQFVQPRLRVLVGEVVTYLPAGQVDHVVHAATLVVVE